jgi:hypothetical protein
MKKVLFAFTLVTCGTTFGQQNTVASGGDATGSGGSVSYSVGQIDYITETGSGGTATQGVQQPYEIFVGFEELSFDLQTNLFPNPTSEAVQLQFSNWESFSAVTFRLSDDRGRLIQEGSIEGEITYISLADLPNAPYHLSLLLDEQMVKNFKIIKNQ